MLAELEISMISLGEEKEQLAISSIEFRELYFKLIKQYITAKHQYGTDKKMFIANEKTFTCKIMGIMLNSIY